MSVSGSDILKDAGAPFKAADGITQSASVKWKGNINSNGTYLYTSPQ